MYSTLHACKCVPFCICMCVCVCVYKHVLKSIGNPGHKLCLFPFHHPFSIDHFPIRSVGGCSNVNIQRAPNLPMCGAHTLTRTHTHTHEARRGERISQHKWPCVCAPVNNIQSGLLKIYLYMMFMMTATQSMSAHTHTHTGRGTHAHGCEKESVVERRQRRRPSPKNGLSSAQLS